MGARFESYDEKNVAPVSDAQDLSPARLLRSAYA
jgi:hypothetical protein